MSNISQIKINQMKKNPKLQFLGAQVALGQLKEEDDELQGEGGYSSSEAEDDEGGDGERLIMPSNMY
jgi:hypothetical protein